MISSVVKVYKQIREEGGIEMVDAIQALFVQKQINDVNTHENEFEHTVVGNGLEAFKNAINGGDMQLYLWEALR